MRWFEAVAPGRVNLIGEHIDYNDLSVLPIAVDRDIRIRFRATEEPTVNLSSTVPEFACFEFGLVEPISPAREGDWSNYVRAAAVGLKAAGFDLHRGIAGEVSGTIPVAAGMSSSSALVVAAAIALLYVNDVSVSPVELASLMASAERYVGVAGGGMDQAACLNGRSGHALRIDFAPLAVSPLPVPSGWSWIVASSMIRAEKSAGAKDAYNQRTKDCRDALEAVWGALGSAVSGRESYRGLRGAAATPELLRIGSTVLTPTHERRFRHVITEADRVLRACDALMDEDMDTFGRLMDESHASMRDDFEVSISELDELVGLAKEHGAAGARLTGAGFGGCVVALVQESRVESLMWGLAQGYFAERVGDQRRLAEVLFQVSAADGARVIPLS